VGRKLLTRVPPGQITEVPDLRTYYADQTKFYLNNASQLLHVLGPNSSRGVNSMRYRITKLDPKGKKTEITTVIADYYVEGQDSNPLLSSYDRALRFYNNVKGFWGPKEPKLVATVALSGDYLVETV